MVNDVFIQGFTAALIAGLITGVGGFMIFLKKKYSREYINVMLNIAAGIMLAASFFSLLSPSLEGILRFVPDRHVAGYWFVGALFSGGGLVWLLNALLPHEHNSAGHHGPNISLRSCWLFIIAISIHKLPEGLAVGVAYSGDELYNPLSLVVGIALQNIPEGLTVAISLVGAGYSRLKAAFYASCTGLVQPIGALIGISIMEMNEKIVPVGMALAGGTLLFVIINEILPETYSTKKSQKSAAAVFLGFVVMAYLSIVLE